MADPVEFLFSLRSLPVDVRAANRVGCRRHDGSKHKRTVAMFIRSQCEIFSSPLPMHRISWPIYTSAFRLIARERETADTRSPPRGGSDWLT